jgi:putative DNA primase/helicase
MTAALQKWAQALQGRVLAGSVRCPGPGHSPADNSLVVTPTPGIGDGFMVYSHAGDDWKLCKDYVRQLLDLPRYARSPRVPDLLTLRAQVPANTLDASERRIEANQIWRASSPLVGSPAYRYLQKRLKGREVPPAIIEGGALRWNPNVRIFGSVGAMIGLMTDPLSGRPTGIQRTYINNQLDNIRGANGKSIRLMLGNKGVVRLWADEEVSTAIAIGEGIETVIAGAIGSMTTPAWAALDADNLEKFPVLPAVEGLTIFVDHDKSGAGQRAAESCAARWYAGTGITARFLTPCQPGDFNDILDGVSA